MESLCDQLLAGAALADHQHRPVERRGTARPLDRVEERGGLADQMGIALHYPALRLSKEPFLSTCKAECRTSHFLGYLTTCWQPQIDAQRPENDRSLRISVTFLNWHVPCLGFGITAERSADGVQDQVQEARYAQLRSRSRRHRRGR